MKKNLYFAPVTEVLSLVSIQETMQSGSAHSAASGPNIVYDTESDFDAYFGS